MTGIDRAAGHQLLENGAVVVASWDDGVPFIVRGVVNGRKRADVNLFPPQVVGNFTYWFGDGGAIMRNALVYQ